MDIRTICNECVFFPHNQCEFNIYNKLKGHNYPGIKFVVINNDQYTIENHVCVFCRNKQWADMCIGQDLMHRARNEVILRATAVIYIENDSLANIEQKLRKTQEVIYTGVLLPKEIIYVNHTDHKISLIKNICEKTKSTYTYIKWSVENIVDPDIKRDAAIDLTVTKVKTPYLLIVNCGTDIPKNLLSNFDIALNDNLDKFIAAVNDEQSIVFIQTTIFKTLGGNLEKPAIEKLTNVLTEQNATYLLTRIN